MTETNVKSQIVETFSNNLQKTKMNINCRYLNLISSNNIYADNTYVRKFVKCVNTNFS